MGEDEAKKTEEPKKVEPKPETTEKQPPPPSDDKKEDKKTEAAAAAPPPPPPPPQEIVLKVYMHCEGCARKVRRCLNGFEGVEEVITDCRTSKVVVKGEKADPLKVLERVQKKSHRQVQLISPLPKPPVEEPKPEEKQVAKTEDKKTEPPPVITVLLGVFMHCEACAQGIKKRIQRMKGVESVIPDLKNSKVTVKGVFEPEKLTDHVYKKCGKHAVIIKVEGEKKEEEKGKEESKEEKKEEKKAEGEGEGEKEAKKVEEKKEGDEEGGGGGEEKAVAEAKAEVVEAEETKMELRKNEFYPYYPHIQSNYQVYPQRYVHQDIYTYDHPPQMFSDENPNACSVM